MLTLLSNGTRMIPTLSILMDSRINCKNSKYFRRISELVDPVSWNIAISETFGVDAAQIRISESLATVSTHGFTEYFLKLNQIRECRR